MFFIKLALKNLTRHKQRVLITASIIALAMALFLIYDSFQAGLNEVSFNNIRNLETGHLQVVNKDYWEERDDLPTKNFLTQTQEVKDLVRKTPHYQAAAPQLKFSANLNNGVDELPVMACGIDPQQHHQVFTTGEYLVAGSMLESGKYQAVLGKKLADLMELKVGDYLTLLFKTRQDTFNTVDAEITGLIHTNNPDVNNNLVYIPLSLAQQALNVENKVSQIVVRLDQNGIAEQVTKELSVQLAEINSDLEAHSWRDSAGEVIAMSKAETVEKITITFLILLIAAVGIINTIILSSLERTKEIGMMKAMGLKEREIITTFMIEAGGIGLIGGLIGCILGGIVILYLNIYGVDLSTLMGDIGDWGLPVMGKLYGVWNLSAFIFVIVFGVVGSLLASILPARWAARMDPVEAMYGNHH